MHSNLKLRKPYSKLGFFLSLLILPFMGCRCNQTICLEANDHVNDQCRVSEEHLDKRIATALSDCGQGRINEDLAECLIESSCEELENPETCPYQSAATPDELAKYARQDAERRREAAEQRITACNALDNLDDRVAEDLHSEINGDLADCLSLRTCEQLNSPDIDTLCPWMPVKE